MAQSITTSPVLSDASLRAALAKLQQPLSAFTISSAGLAIKAGGSAIVKAGSAFVSIVDGVLVYKAANTDMAALSGSVAGGSGGAATAYNVFAFFVDAAGTLTSSMGTAGATMAAVVFPSVAATKAVIGFIVVAPTGTGAFVGGTTALDDATVVPAVVYINCVGPFSAVAYSL
ncbi:MAG: hypothetical protein WC052_05310 [Patescibacteria group bacterium]